MVNNHLTCRIVPMRSFRMSLILLEKYWGSKKKKIKFFFYLKKRLKKINFKI